MKRLKKMTALLLAIACMLTFAACGGESNETTAPVVPDETLSEQIGNVFEQMESIGAENAGQEVGSYADGSDADFGWVNVEGGVAITEYVGTATAVAIPAQLGGQNVVAIGEGAFADSAVVGVSMPDTVVEVGNQAFFYCMALVEVKLSHATTTIGEDAFHGCTALSNIQLNDGLKTIGMSAFTMTSNLNQVTIPDSVEYIGDGAFLMSGLETVTVPGAVQYVGDRAFSNCKSMTNVVIEEGVTSLKDEVFSGCDALTSVEVPASVAEFGFDVFGYCDNLVIHAPAGSPMESYAVKYEYNFQSN